MTKKNFPGKETKISPQRKKTITQTISNVCVIKLKSKRKMIDKDDFFILAVNKSVQLRNNGTMAAENSSGCTQGQWAAQYRAYLTWDSSKSIGWLLDCRFAFKFFFFNFFLIDFLLRKKGKWSIKKQNWRCPVYRSVNQVINRNNCYCPKLSASVLDRPLPRLRPGIIFAVAVHRERLTGKLLSNALEELLNGRAVPDERAGHRETARGNVTNGGLDVVWNPFDEIASRQKKSQKNHKKLIKMKKNDGRNKNGEKKWRKIRTGKKTEEKKKPKRKEKRIRGRIKTDKKMKRKKKLKNRGNGKNEEKVQSTMDVRWENLNFLWENLKKWNSFARFHTCCSCSESATYYHPLPSCSCVHGRWPPRWGSARDADHRPPSCSSRRTSAASAPPRTAIGTPPSCATTAAQSPAWKSAAAGRAPCSRPICGDPRWAGPGSGDTWSRRTWSPTPAGSSRRTSDWTFSGCGSKCRREPRCRCRRSRRCSPPAGARTAWRCTAPPPYLTPENQKKSARHKPLVVGQKIYKIL